MLWREAGGPSLPPEQLSMWERQPCSAQRVPFPSVPGGTGAASFHSLSICTAAAATSVESNKPRPEIFMEVHTCMFLLPGDATQAILQGIFLPRLLNVEAKLKDSHVSYQGA